MIFFGDKKLQFYKNILIKADLGLHEQIADKIIQKYPPAQSVKILDLGAGEGALTQRLVDAGYSVVAADKEERTFKASCTEFYTIDFNKEEVSKFKEKYRKSFDIVLGVEVIEHLENPWEYIRTLNYMLKDNGMLLLTTPNITSWYSRLIFLRSGQFHQFFNTDLSYGHIMPISAWQLKNILEEESFQHISFFPGGTLPDLWIKPSVKWVIFNMIAIILRIFMKNNTQGWCLIVTAHKNGKLYGFEGRE